MAERLYCLSASISGARKRKKMKMREHQKVMLLACEAAKGRQGQLLCCPAAMNVDDDVSAASKKEREG